MTYITSQDKNRLFNHLRNDTSVWPLIGSNLLTIIIAVIDRWNLHTLMLVYWFQSVIIGIVNFIRILTIKNFSTEGVKVNDKPMEATKKAKTSMAFFFVFHYGFFHFVYLIFILTSSKFKGSNIIFIFLISVVFFINHFYSFLYNRKKDTKKQNIGRIFFFPYARIIPMHLTIIFGSLLARGKMAVLAVVFFLLLKTIADIIMHAVEHA